MTLKLIGPPGSKYCVVINSAKDAIKFSGASKPLRAYESDIFIQVSIVCGYLCQNSYFQESEDQVEETSKLF